MPLTDDERRKAAGDFFRNQFKRAEAGKRTAVVERDGTFAALDAIENWYQTNQGTLIAAIATSWKNQFPGGPGRDAAIGKLIAAWAMAKADLIRSR